MNRKDAALFDSRVADWLEEDPELAPREALEVVLAAFPSINQRRARVPSRFPGLPSMPRFAVAGSALVVALAVVALFGPLLGSGPGGTPETTPIPSAAPTASPSPGSTRSPMPTIAPLDTSAWVDATSERYGIELRRPADWSVQAADHDWTIAEAIDFSSTGHDQFRSSDLDVGVSVWAYDPGPGVSLETVDEIVAWVEDFCAETDSEPCTGIPARAVPLCRERADCHAAVLVPFRNDTYAFIPGYAEDGKMIIAAVWRSESDPSVVPYGGARNLLLGFLSTINGGGGAGVYLDPSP